MQTPTTEAAHQRIRANAPEYFGFSDVEDPTMWLAFYLNNLADQVALKHLYQTQDFDEGTTHALHFASVLLTDKVRETAKECQRCGLLPFAWHGTQYFRRHCATQGPIHATH